MDSDDFFLLSVFFAVTVLFSAGVTMGVKDLIWQKQAIEHNAAEWRIDPKTGDKEFVWLTCEEK